VRLIFESITLIDAGVLEGAAEDRANSSGPQYYHSRCNKQRINAV
jgi:hypothetical protein